MSVGSSKEPNLTPFIDLLSMLVCFLMVTAAWVYLDVFQTSLEKAAKDGPAPENVVAPVDPPKPKAKLTAVVRARSVIMGLDEKSTSVPHKDGRPDDRLIASILTDWRKRFPDRKDVTLSSDNDAFYGDVIAMFDILNGSGWPDIAMNPR